MKQKIIDRFIELRNQPMNKEEAEEIVVNEFIEYPQIREALREAIKIQSTGSYEKFLSTWVKAQEFLAKSKGWGDNEISDEDKEIHISDVNSFIAKLSDFDTELVEKEFSNPGAMFGSKWLKNRDVYEASQKKMVRFLLDASKNPERLMSFWCFD